MPRSTKDESLASLKAAVSNLRKLETAREAARAKVHKAMVRAVKAGNTRHAVAKVAHVSPKWVGMVEGMPRGRNVTVNDADTK